MVVESDNGADPKMGVGSVSLWYWLVPIIFGVLVASYVLLKNLSDGLVWYSGFVWVVAGFIVPLIVSMAIFLFTKWHSSDDKGVEYNGTPWCDNFIRDRMRYKGINLKPFVSINFSQSYVLFFGKPGTQKVKVYISTWRDLELSGCYYLIFMNMQKGHEDDMCVERVQMNATKKEVERLIELNCNRMAEEQAISRPNVIINEDPMTGRRMIQTKYDNLEDSVPKDVDID